MLDKFEDERLVGFGKKIIFQEAPHVLPESILKQVKRDIAKRILSDKKEKWWTCKEFYFECDNLRDKFTNENDEKVLLWKQGRTGVPFVDAAMRELYVTGRMHNRGRMIVASFLTKHLMTHWKIGLKWFENCLIDWDPASNAMGWQWSAGSGPDATPYFRVFNPNTQLEKFDKENIYRNRWLAEFSGKNSKNALSFFDAIPKKWKLKSGMEYPESIVDLSEGRTLALEAYKNRQF